MGVKSTTDIHMFESKSKLISVVSLDNNKFISKAISATMAPTVQTSNKMPKAKAIPPHQIRGITTKSMRNNSTGIIMIAESHASASSAITARATEQFMCVITLISVILIVL